MFLVNKEVQIIIYIFFCLKVVKITVVGCLYFVEQKVEGNMALIVGSIDLHLSM